MTLFPVFDVPVFWPILLLYFITLFILTMKRQVKASFAYSREKLARTKGLLPLSTRLLYLVATVPAMFRGLFVKSTCNQGGAVSMACNGTAT